MTHPFNHFYVRKLVKITSKVGSNRNKFFVAKCSKRVNFGETSLKIIEKLERIRYGTQMNEHDVPILEYKDTIRSSFILFL